MAPCLWLCFVEVLHSVTAIPSLIHTLHTVDNCLKMHRSCCCDSLIFSIITSMVCIYNFKWSKTDNKARTIDCGQHTAPFLIIISQNWLVVKLTLTFTGNVVHPLNFPHCCNCFDLRSLSVLQPLSAGSHSFQRM